MAELNTQYYQGNDQYSDGEVEERILRIVQEKKSLEESGERSFPVLYHLSQVRENILSWYDFREGASILEIGAGPGAITGLLCRRCAQVTAVELSLLRAQINYERHKDFENLKIMVGNLNDMQFGQKFDYVILNGVFEYAGSFTEGPDPYGTFLRRCADYLKEDGLLLIAIENRLGLKYFAGAPEDHTGNYMEGLKEYPENRAVHTFSRQEWEELCERCSLPYRRFYYPYPDYKFPNEIFTQETLSADGFSRCAWNFNPDRLELFSEQAMGTALCREGVMASFMNSFLIEAGGEAAGSSRRGDQILYAKISSDRAPEYRIQTVIHRRLDGTEAVVKSPLTKEARGHLRRMHERETQSLKESASSSSRFRLLQSEMLSDGSLVYPFLEADSLAKRLEADPSSIRNACRALLEGILTGCSVESVYTEEFTEMFGTARSERTDGKDLRMVSPANIDLIFDNIFPGEEHDDVIDGEWITDTPVPALFLLWRAVNELYSGRRELERVLPREKLLKEYGIDAALQQVFWKWATHFEKEYVKANRLADYALPVKKADLKDLLWSGQDVRLTATLYLDRGSGWREEDAIHTDVFLENGKYDVTFEIEDPAGVRALRFDPLEGSPCICDLCAAQGELRQMNASALSQGGWVFLTEDPAYQVRCAKVPGKLRVTGGVRIKDLRWALEKSQELLKAARLGPAGNLARRVLRHVR